MSEKEFTERQTDSLRATYITLSICFAFEASFALFNIFAYVVKQKKRKTLVVIFYVFVLLQSIPSTVFFTCLSLQPNQDPFLFDTQGFKYYEFLEVIGSSATLALSWVVTVTMYQLSISIRVIFQILTPSEGKTRRMRMYIFAATMASLQLLMILLTPCFPFPYRTWVITDVYYFSYTTLILVYSTVVFLLFSTLNKMRDFFKREYCVIKTQSTLFLIAFCSKLVLQLSFQIGGVMGWSNYAYYMLQAISNFLVDLIPANFMLYAHHRTFREDKINEERVAAAMNDLDAEQA